MKKKIALFLALSVSGTCYMYGKEAKVTFEELPQKAQTFVNANFKEQPIKEIVKSTEEEIDTYKVSLKNKTAIEFDQTGTWNEVKVKKGAIPNTLLPTTISEYIKNNYSSMPIKKVENDGYNIEVKLKNNMELDFNVDGELVKKEVQK